MRGTVCTGGEGYGARKLGGGGRIAAVGMVHPPVHGGSKEVASRTWQLNEIQQVLKYILAVYDLINTRQTTNFLIASSVYWISNFAWYELRLRYFTKEFNLSSWCNSRNISAIYILWRSVVHTWTQHLSDNKLSFSYLRLCLENNLRPMITILNDIA